MTWPPFKVKVMLQLSPVTKTVMTSLLSADFRYSHTVGNSNILTHNITCLVHWVDITVDETKNGRERTR